MSEIEKHQKDKINLYRESRIRNAYDEKTLESNKFMKETTSKEK